MDYHCALGMAELLAWWRPLIKSCCHNHQEINGRHTSRLHWPQSAPHDTFIGIGTKCSERLKCWLNPHPISMEHITLTIWATRKYLVPFSIYDKARFQPVKEDVTYIMCSLTDWNLAQPHTGNKIRRAFVWSHPGDLCNVFTWCHAWLAV